MEASDMITDTPRATPMMIATLNKSAAPLMKISMKASTLILSIIATMMLATRNTAVSSGNHHPIVGQIVTPRSSQDSTPQIMIRKDNPNTIRMSLRFKVKSGRSFLSNPFPKKKFLFYSACA